MSVFSSISKRLFPHGSDSGTREEPTRGCGESRFCAEENDGEEELECDWETPWRGADSRRIRDGRRLEVCQSSPYRRASSRLQRESRRRRYGCHRH
jgi:hypothetical protein